MLLKVNNTYVGLSYSRFREPGTRAILSLHLQYSAERNELHRGLSSKLREVYGAVMDKGIVVSDRNEIRLLGTTMLEAIDVMRMLGYGVSEMPPD